jgi:hypothetical protein
MVLCMINRHIYTAIVVLCVLCIIKRKDMYQPETHSPELVESSCRYRNDQNDVLDIPLIVPSGIDAMLVSTHLLFMIMATEPSVQYQHKYVAIDFCVSVQGLQSNMFRYQSMSTHTSEEIHNKYVHIQHVSRRCHKVYASIHVRLTVFKVYSR